MNIYDLELIFDLLIKNSSTCSVLVDLDGNIIRFNEAYRDLIGYTDDEIRSKANSLYVSEEAYQREINFINQLLKGGKSDIQFTSSRLAKNNRVVQVEVTAILFTDKAGKPEFVLKRIKDITDSVISEEFYRNQQIFLKTVMQEVPLRIYFKDKDSRFIMNSKAHVKFLGFTSEKELLGKSDFDFFHESHAQQAFDDEQKIMASGESIVKEEKVIQKDGKTTWAQSVKSPLKDINGEIIGTYGITRDITALKLAEENLILKNSQLEETIEELKRTQNKLAFAEKMAALGNLIGGIAHEINTPLGAIKASSSNISEVVDKINVDLPWLIKNATPTEINWLFSFLNEADSRDISVFSKEERQKKRDLTSLFEENNIENAAIVADTLVSLKLNYNNDMYLRFLKQPNAQKLLNILKVLFSLKRNTNNITVSVEKAAKVVRALRSYIYKNNTGEFETADLTETINTVLILTANLIKHSKTEIVTDFVTIPPIFCRQDEICQVWTNIITNGIQAMGEGGKMEIGIRYDEAGEMIKVWFKDNGPGIPDDVKPRIFEPYFTTKAKGSGTGMGLDISRQIIESHNGKIYFNSENGQGTTFIIEIPVNQEKSSN